jgi:hypothetical protein
MCGILNLDSTAPDLVGIKNYALTFAKSDGGRTGSDPRSSPSADALERVLPGKLESIHGLCWFLQWGSFGGNTLVSPFPKTVKQMIFRGIFSVYYGPLYGLIVVTSKLLSVFPSDGPKAINGIMGGVLCCVASIWIIPVGVVSKLLGY